MKIKRTAYKVDEFTDYAGNTRKFVIAAVSLIPEEDDYYGIALDEYGSLADIPVNKVLSLGVAVCRPNDEFNEEIGIKIATGKAIKSESHRIYSVDEGLINNTMVEALLKQECEYFKSNPGRYLKGYDKDMEKHIKKESVKDLLNSGKPILDLFESMDTDELKKALTLVCVKLGLI